MSAAIGDVTLYNSRRASDPALPNRPAFRGREVSADEALALVHSADRRVSELCDEARALRAAGADADAVRRVKARLPAIAWAGTYRDGRRREANFLRPSGVVPLDLDDVGPGDLEALDAWPHLYARWTSAGGRTHGLARVRVETPDEHPAAAATVRDELVRLGLVLDSSWDAPRLLYVSASPVVHGRGVPLEPRTIRPAPIPARTKRPRVRSEASQAAWLQRQRELGTWGGLVSGINRRSANLDRDREIVALHDSGLSLREIGRRVARWQEAERPLSGAEVLRVLRSWGW